MGVYFQTLLECVFGCKMRHNFGHFKMHVCRLKMSMLIVKCYVGMVMMVLFSLIADIYFW